MRVIERKVQAVRVVSWLISILLTLVVGVFAITYFVPGYSLYIVRSESMKPAIKLGDAIIAGPVGGPLNGEIRPGTIVTYKHSKELITHRVINIDGERLITKGDATEEADPWKVTMADVQSVYLFKIPYLGFIINFTKSKLGYFLVILAPATVLVALLVKDILKEAFSSS